MRFIQDVMEFIVLWIVPVTALYIVPHPVYNECVAIPRLLHGGCLDWTLQSVIEILQLPPERDIIHLN